MKLKLICAIATLFFSGCNSQSKSDVADDNVVGQVDFGPLVKDNSGCSDTAVYRFDAVSPDGSDNRRIFIDFQNARSGTVSRGSLATDSHFGGSVRDCSTDSVRCVDAGQLAFAWPIDSTQTTFALGSSQCRRSQLNGTAHVSCFVGKELAIRYRITEDAIDRAELFYPEHPEYPDAVFEAVDAPLPLCKI